MLLLVTTTVSWFWTAGWIKRAVGHWTGTWWCMMGHVEGERSWRCLTRRGRVWTGSVCVCGGGVSACSLCVSLQDEGWNKTRHLFRSRAAGRRPCWPQSPWRCCGYWRRTGPQLDLTCVCVCACAYGSVTSSGQRVFFSLFLQASRQIRSYLISNKNNNNVIEPLHIQLIKIKNHSGDIHMLRLHRITERLGGGGAERFSCCLHTSLELERWS